MSNVGPAASDSELSLDFDNIDSHTDYLLTENLPVKVKENGFTGSLLTQTSTPLLWLALIYFLSHIRQVTLHPNFPFCKMAMQ